MFGEPMGISDTMLLVLEMKLGPAGLAFGEELQKIADLPKLRAVRDATKAAGSVEELREVLARTPP